MSFKFLKRGENRDKLLSTKIKYSINNTGKNNYEIFNK